MIQNCGRQPALLLALLLCVTARVVYPQGLWPMTAFGEFSASNEQILAYYDFNRDRNVDIVTCVQSPTSELRIYIWNDEVKTFVKRVGLDLGLFNPVSVIPADLTQDGTVELVVSLEVLQSSDDIRVVLYSANCTSMACSINPVERTPTTTLTQPTVMLLRGQHAIVYNQGGSLVVETYENGRFIVRNFTQEYMGQFSDSTVMSICADYVDMFYLDYDGDCLLDIVVHCSRSSGMKDLQFYKGDELGKFKPEKAVSIEIGFELLGITFADLNFDGLEDVIGLCNNAAGELLFEIHYNTAIKSLTSQCTITYAKQTKQYFPYHFVNNQSELTQAVFQIQRVSLKSNYSQWSPNHLHSDNFILRAGDINNDGYFDLIVDGPNRAVLLINQQCLNSSCGTYNPRFMENWALGSIRTFSVRGIDGMAGFKNSICDLSFFDLHEDGRLDLFGSLCVPGSSPDQQSESILPIYNSLAIDAFFLKISVMENPSNQTIKSDTMDRKPNAYGVHADFYVTALNGEAIPASGNQLSHPGRSLQLPYIHTGLGRTNNYVQQVEVSMSGKESYLNRSWTPIVPNSQLIIVPGPKWLLETYISPTAIMAVLFWFVVLVLVVIGLYIGRLTQREKQEDKDNEDSFYSILR